MGRQYLRVHQGIVTASSNPRMHASAPLLLCIDPLMHPWRRLVSLPPNVRWQIARTLGRDSRALSTALLEDYGPLDCGLQTLRLSRREEAALQLEQLLLSGSAERLRHVTCLQLGGERHAVRCRDWPALLVLVSQRLPSLRSLLLETELEASNLAVLAPLFPALTSLCIALTPPASAVHLATLQSLQSLRSLTLRLALRVTAEVVALLEALGHLPHLVQLAFPEGCPWRPHFLLPLAAHVPQLTSLSLGYFCEAVTEAPAAPWDDATTAALQTGLALLRTLSFEARAGFGQRAADLPAMLAALVRCSGLRAIDLRLRYQAPGDPRFDDMAADLARLPLASLTAVLSEVSNSTVEQLLRAAQAQSQLTMLHLSYGTPLDCSPGYALRDYRYLPSSVVDLRVQGHWEPAALMRRVQQLPRLRALERFPDRGWDPARVRAGEAVGAVVVEALMPRLLCLSSLRLVDVRMTEDVRGALVSVAQARGCILDLA
jgi:hypothetical protein